MDKYRLSFTTGGLYYRESIKFIELYLIHRDWSKVRQKILSENLLQLNTHSSQVRAYREISCRLQQLTDIELELFMGCSEQDKRYLLWLGLCRYYTFIEHFSVEVLREKFLSMDMILTHHDYDVFFNQKSEWHDELDALSQSTRNKLRQILFRILIEVGLLSRNNSIIPTIITPQVAREIFKPSNSQAVIYPISDADLGEVLS